MKDRKKASRDLPGVTTTLDEKGNVVAVEPASTDRLRVEVMTNKLGAMVHDENPFLREYSKRMDVRKKSLTVKRGTAIISPGGGDVVQGLTTVEQVVEMDRKTFVKVFSGPGFKSVYNLSSTGIKVFLMLVDLVGEPGNMNQHYIRFTWPIAQKLIADTEFSMSYSTFNRGMKELVDNDYIAAAIVGGEVEGWYWLNVDKVFNGSTVLLKQKISVTGRNKTHPVKVTKTDVDNMTRSLFEEPTASENDVPHPDTWDSE